MKFLTTPGVNYYLEKLLKEAKLKIILISPFLQLQWRIKEILKQKKDQGVEIIFVCRLKDLKESLDELSTNVIDVPTLHAKCYMSEQGAIITSLNLYEFSQQNNDEMGFYIKNTGSSVTLYEEVLEEAERLSQRRSHTHADVYTCNIDIEVGNKYSLEQLDAIFNFSYKKPAGIKKSQSGDIVLFSSSGDNIPYEDKENGGILLFQGQNTGTGEQKLIYGNKELYNAFLDSSIKVFLLRDYIYLGEYNVDQKPYTKNGRWIFPLIPVSQFPTSTTEEGSLPF